MTQKKPIRKFDKIAVSRTIYRISHADRHTLKDIRRRIKRGPDGGEPMP